MENQWEINEWGSTLNLGWLPFIDEVYISMYFTSKDSVSYFISETTTTCFITKDTNNYFVSKGDS